MREILGNGSRSALIVVAACVGAAGLATGGCSDSVRVAKWSAGDLAEEYASGRQVVLRVGRYRYRLEAKNDPALELEVKDWQESYSAPLDAFRKRGDSLVLPTGLEVHPDKLTEVRLLPRGEELTQLRQGGTKPWRPRWMIGAQFGGSAVFQLLLRMRVVGPLHAEAGAFVFGSGGVALMNASAGLVVDQPVSAGFSVYGGGGVGFGGGVAGESEEGAGTLSASYWHARMGLGYRFKDRGLRIGVDGGFWYGVYSGSDDDTDRFLIPMGGLVLLYEL
jgi:hypothetical protein